MKYVSTRNAAIQVTFEQAISMGYAPDGGLFVPESLPRVSPYILKLWSRLDYPHLALSLLRLFISPDEISDNDLYDVITRAFRGDKTKKAEGDDSNATPLFDDPSFIPIQDVGGPAPQVPCLHMVELFHGPTFCFKDFAMRVLVNLLSHFATKRQQPTTLLVATTGDTGPAAVRAVADEGNALLNLVVHYPQGQISEFQRRQLLVGSSSQLQEGAPPNVKVVAYQGGGDDMDANIKTILKTQQRTSSEEASNTVLTGVNSYNIGRPLVQMVHFLWTYLRVAEKLEKQQAQQQAMPFSFPPLDIILPTGAMGNLAAGYMVKRMGVPIARLVAAVNSNDVTHRIFATGQMISLPQMTKTLSEAINIQNPPYNLERILFYATGGHNHQLIQQWMTQHEAALAQQGAPPFTLPLDFVQHYLQQEFYSYSVTDAEMLETLQKFNGQFGYLADPHTGVAVTVALKLGYPTRNHPAPTALLATAAPCKFQEAMTAALGLAGWNAYRESPDFPAAAKALYQMDPAQVPHEAAVYAVLPGQSPMSAETQAQWLEQTKGMIAELARAHGNAPPVYGAPQPFQVEPQPQEPVPPEPAVPQQQPVPEGSGSAMPTSQEAPVPEPQEPSQQPADSMPLIVEVGSEMEKSHGAGVTPVASASFGGDNVPAPAMSFGGDVAVAAAPSMNEPQVEDAVEEGPTTTNTVEESKPDDSATAALTGDFATMGVSASSEQPEFSTSTDAGVVSLEYDPSNNVVPVTQPTENAPAPAPVAPDPVVTSTEEAPPATATSTPDDPFALPSPDKLASLGSQYNATTTTTANTTMPPVVPPPASAEDPSSLPTVDSSSDMAAPSDLPAPADLFAAPAPVDSSNAIPAPSDLPAPGEMPAPSDLDVFAAPSPAAGTPPSTTPDAPAPAVESSPALDLATPPQDPAPAPAPAPPPAPTMTNTMAPAPAAPTMMNTMAQAPAAPTMMGGMGAPPADDDDPFAFLSAPSSAPLPAPAPYSMPAPAPANGMGFGSMAAAPAAVNAPPPIVSTVSSDSDTAPIVATGSSESVTMMVMGTESVDAGVPLDRGSAPADPILQVDSNH